MDSETSALLTDLYQLTMAYGYWKVGRAEERAVFHLFFRHAPFDGSFAVACGLPSVLELMDALRFSHDDLDYLATLDKKARHEIRRKLREPFVD